MAKQFWRYLALFSLLLAALLPSAVSTLGEFPAGFIADGFAVSGMEPHVFVFRQGNEVLRAVVVSNPVDVMHVHVSPKQLPVGFLPDQTMFQHVPIFGDVGMVRSVQEHVAVLTDALRLRSRVGMWDAFALAAMMALYVGARMALVPAQIPIRVRRNWSLFTAAAFTQSGRNQGRVWRDLMRRWLADHVMSRQIALLLVPALGIIRQRLTTPTRAQPFDWRFGFGRSMSPAVHPSSVDSLFAAALA